MAKRNMARKNLAKIKAKFKLPTGFGQKLGPAVAKRLMELAPNPNLTATQIVKQMRGEGSNVNQNYVSRIRRECLGIIAFRGSVSPKAVERASQLFRKWDFPYPSVTGG